jgi:hypothetical protein
MADVDEPIPKLARQRFTLSICPGFSATATQAALVIFNLFLTLQCED